MVKLLSSKKGAMAGTTSRSGIFGGSGERAGEEKKPLTGIWQIFSLDFWINLVPNILIWIGPRLGKIFFIFIVACVVMIAYPYLKNISSPSQIAAMPMAAYTAFANVYTLVQHSIECASIGCADTTAGTDKRVYGIYLNSVYSDRNRYLPGQDIIVSADPTIVLLNSVDYSSDVVLGCGIEDGTVKTKTPETINMKELAGKKSRFKCVFNPIVSPQGSTKKANINVSYKFYTTTSIPVALVDNAEYQRLDAAYTQTTETRPETEQMIAEHYGVEQYPPADPKTTPLIIGAKVDQPQPIPVGYEITVSLKIENRDKGLGDIDGIELDLPDGISLKKTVEYDPGGPNPVQVGEELLNRYILKKDNLLSLQEGLIPGDFKIIDLVLDTTGFNVQDKNNALTKKIAVRVDYSYTATGSAWVTVTTCSQAPTEKGCGQQTPAPDVPITVAVAGGPGSR